MRIEFTNSGLVLNAPGEMTAFLSFKDEVMSTEAARADRMVGGAISRALAVAAFAGKRDEVLSILAASSKHAGAFLLVGAGAKETSNDLSYERSAATAYKEANARRASTIEIRMPGLAAAQAARIAFGVRLAAYRFNKYRTTSRPDEAPTVTCVRVLARDPLAAEQEFAQLAGLAEGVCFARDLASEPPNILFPAEFANRVTHLEALGLKVEVLGEAEMTRLGMGALIGVGQGSQRESQLVVLRWMGGPKKEPPIAFVGKGVCFDSGGISLKQPKGMESMKWDMGGAAAVAGAMLSLARRKAAVNAVGILALVENMPDGAAQRPGDIVRTMSGQTIEIINTDAEGRLILADALWYCQTKFKPRAMIDIATLTGMVQTALGKEYAGVFSNCDDLARALISAGDAEGERLWRLPLTPEHEKQIESLAADMKNADDSNVGGGAITAAILLQRFVNGCPWAHLDIAGVAWRDPSTSPTTPAGATGFGVRLLDRLASETCPRQPTRT